MLTLEKLLATYRQSSATYTYNCHISVSGNQTHQSEASAEQIYHVPVQQANVIMFTGNLLPTAVTDG